MGLLDRLKTNRPGDDNTPARAPADFDELQAAGDDGRTVTIAINRATDLDVSAGDTTNAGALAGQSIISELPPSEQLSDFSEPRLLPGVGMGRAPAAAAPVDVLVTRWGADEFARGSYSFAAVGSDPEMRDALADGIGGRVHLAGEATSREHPATVHGALLSGRRAAESVLDDLGA